MAAAGRTDRETRQFLLTTFWEAALGFWRRGAKSKAWLLTLTLVAIVVVNLAVQYRINVWHREMFDALEKRDSSRVMFQSLIFLPLTFLNVSLAVAALYARMTTQRSWRAWLNDNVLDRWLSNGRYYQLNLVAGDQIENQIAQLGSRDYSNVRFVRFSTLEWVIG